MSASLMCVFLFLFAYGFRERVLEYRDESQRLDQCSRLYDLSVFNGGFELDASRIFQVLLSILKKKLIASHLLVTQVNCVKHRVDVVITCNSSYS